tara:strand:+ start:337 stop:999 length:663 start_codon:yes stop_codon:yes gene_type:complete
MRNGIAVLGGTFDPVHHGHLESARAIRDVLSVEEVRLIPSFQPPHRNPPESSAEHRLAMLRAAMVDLPNIAVDDREIRREGVSFTVDTLTSLRREVGLGVPIYFIMGMDAFCTLDEWYEWQEITELAHIVVLQRPGHEMQLSEDMVKWIKGRESANVEELQNNPGKRVCFLELEQISVSSTDIRRAFHCGEVPEAKLPRAVSSYIKSHDLYQPENSNAEC